VSILLLDYPDLVTDPGNVFLSSQCSLRSDASDGGTRHLALVFFDVLLLDSRPLTCLPYRERRRIMESIVLPIPGFSILAERSPIDLTKGINAATAQLKYALAQALADHQEGLVLKADEGEYIKSPWVKVHTRCYLDDLA
jgi:DNA ligase-4